MLLNLEMSLLPVKPFLKAWTYFLIDKKVISLADSSNLGWFVGKEYQQNPLASDSQDEKSMMCAETRASKKVKQCRFEKAGSMRQCFQPYQQCTATVTATTTSGQLQQGNGIQTLRPVRRRRLGVSYSLANPVTGSLNVWQGRTLQSLQIR